MDVHSTQVTLPCKIGDEVWGIRKHWKHDIVMPGIVSEMYYLDDMSLAILVHGVCRGQWGTAVFPTYEAAQAAIKERKRK